MLTLISRERISSDSTRTGHAQRFPLGPPPGYGIQNGGIEEEEIVTRLRWLAAARLHTQCAFEHGVHASETLQADLRSALDQGKDDLARRLIQVLSPVSLEREALSLQVEAIDQESRVLRTRLNRLRRLSPGHEEPARGLESAELWLDAEMRKRREALQGPAAGNE